jgi:hypothetical protein
MWPFKKRSSSDTFLKLLPQIEQLVAERWVYFSNTLVFKEGVPLKERFLMFLQPMEEGIKMSFPQLRDSPQNLLMLAVARGVVRSGTVSKVDLAASLNFPIEVLE